MLMVTTILLFCGCRVKSGYQLSQSTSSIVSIEMVEVSGDGAEYLSYLGTITVICTLERNEWNNLLTDLQRVQCYSYLNDPWQCIRDEAICITYEDGTIELLSYPCAGVFRRIDESGNYKGCYFNKEQFMELWNQYSNR